MTLTILILLSIFDFLKSNIWVISLAAIIISLASFLFVVMDKVKTWNENSQIKKLKRDKAILQPIIELDINKFRAVRVEKTPNSTSTIHKADYSNIYSLFQSIFTDKLSNREIAFKINEIKKLKDEDLIIPKNAPSSSYFSLQFNQAIIELIHDVKTYLAVII